MSDEKPRQIAARILRESVRQGTYVENLLEVALDQAQLSSPDRALLQELVFGVVRWQATLDWLIGRKTDARKQPVGLQVLLRLALYQMFWLNRIPDHAAVFETVELAKAEGFESQAGFLNAVLRGYGREREETQGKLQELKQTDPASGYSHPAWLCDRWQSRWGEESLRRLLEWNNLPPPTYARLNRLRADSAHLQAQWQEEQVQATAKQFDWTDPDEVFEIKSAVPWLQLASFQQGGFYIQDPSTLLSVKMLDPQPGESILDFCAAPGGKTTFIAQKMNNKGSIMAQDLDIRRRNMIAQNCERLGVTMVTISRATTTVNHDLSNPFDRILVDAPCSNTGVLRRRVEARWRVNQDELNRLSALQLEVLERCWRQLRSGGVLVYSTCSLESEENQGTVAKFLKQNPNFTLESERELLPFRDGVDGGYVARLRAP